ncbi:MAG: hypothetical protein QXJ06_05960 [Candidatus Aenigmatarchaeota archaeon]
MRENHKLEGFYVTENCNILIKGGEPYILINLEKFCELKKINSPHCDFIYLLFQNNQYHLFLVELKSMGELGEKELIDILDRVNKKFHKSKEMLVSMFRNFSINLNNNSIIHNHNILVIQNVGKINALLKKLTTQKYREIKIIPSGGSIWDY